MKCYIRIVALAIAVSAASLQALDENANMNPWAQPEREVKLANKRAKLDKELYGAYDAVYGAGPTYKQPWNPAYRYALERKIRILESGSIIGRMRNWIAQTYGYTSPYAKKYSLIKPASKKN